MANASLQPLVGVTVYSPDAEITAVVEHDRTIITVRRGKQLGPWLPPDDAITTTGEAVDEPKALPERTRPALKLVKAVGDR